ncbi:pilus assembly protein PilQ [Sulfurihydrogenibium azorense]|uniref:pilus assembly protein PilQ n=1 Tax=Sulfurihydrogenibium azorense TaxID=309806 RepID=UPI00391A7275
MKKVKNSLLVLVIGSITPLSLSFAEKVSIELNNAKLSTVVDAISQVSSINIIWDKDAIAQKDKLVYVSIKKPYDPEKLLNLILVENGLIAIKEGDVYKIRLSDEYFVSIPPEVIKTLEKDIFDEIVLTIKKNASSSALIEADRNTYTVYLKDKKDNVYKIKNIVSAYVDNLKKQAEEIAKLQKEQGQLLKKEFNMSYEDYRLIEDKIIESIGPFGRYNYDKEKGILTILDTKDNILNLTRVVGKATKEKIETKCFYARGLEPGEIIMNIRENYLSENGTVIFKSKEALEIGGTETRQLSTTGGTQTGITAGLTKSTSQPATIITSLPKICITDRPDIIEKIKYRFSDYLLDRPYQISIEARIVQISSRNVKDLGIQWGGLASNIDNNNTKIIAGTNSPSYLANFRPNSAYAVDFPATQSKIPGGFSLGFILGGTQNFLDIRLSALQSIGKSKILSKPSVITIDGETAEISQGYEIPYTTAIAAGGGTVSSVSFKKAVLKLNVTPRTTADGNIIMDLIITQDIPDFKNLLLGNPPIQTKTVTSKVVAKDGSVVVIGGILEKTEDTQTSGVPRLMNIPIIGNLFKETFKQDTSTELLIFLSPKIVYE